MHTINESLETIVGNLAKLCFDRPGNKLIICRNKIKATEHPLLSLVEGIDYSDQEVMDMFQHHFLEHVQLEDTVHGFKNIKPNNRYNGEVIWCTGAEMVGAIQVINYGIADLSEEDRSSMNLDVVSCGGPIGWNEVLTFLKSDSQCRIGCIRKPDTIYHAGVDLYKKLTMKIPKEIPMPLVFDGFNPSDRLWFVYKDRQPNVRINDELKSYRVVYL